MRKLVAGLVGGLLMFGWGGLVHTKLKFVEASIRPLADEAALIGGLEAGTSGGGLYVVPGLPPLTGRADEDEKARAEWEERSKTVPAGFLILRAPGTPSISPRQLLTECASNVLACLCAAIVLGHLAGSYGKRLGLVVLLGLLAFFSIAVSTWNWYLFPTAFLALDLVDQLGGFAVAGAAMAAIVRAPGR